MKILDLYIARILLSTSALCLLVLTGLSGIIKWVDQLRLVGRGTYSMMDAGIYVLFLVPRDIEMFFPMAVLLGALIGMGMLASNSELVVMQASGMSRLQITMSAMKTAVPLMLLVMVLGEWGAPIAEQKANELQAVLGRAVSKLELLASASAVELIASRSRGTPRIANRLLRRVRDFALVEAANSISAELAATALDIYEVDSLGLDRLDKQVLLALINKFEGRPVGLATLAVALGEEPDTIESVVEPYLLREGLIERTPKGRQATALAHRHLGLPL